MFATGCIGCLRKVVILEPQDNTCSACYYTHQTAGFIGSCMLTPSELHSHLLACAPAHSH